MFRPRWTVERKGEFKMSTVYQCIKSDARYIPTRMTVVYEAETQKEAIEWLENNGGGIYRNTLHGFQYNVQAHNYESGS